MSMAANILIEILLIVRPRGEIKAHSEDASGVDHRCFTKLLMDPAQRERYCGEKHIVSQQEAIS